MRFPIGSSWVRLVLALAVIAGASCAGPGEREEDCDAEEQAEDGSCPDAEPEKDWNHRPSRPYRQPPSVPPDDSRVPGSY